LLLAVNVPQLSGLDLLRGLSTPRPAVVLTTAHAEYAVQGFDRDAVDFLLKPFSFERLIILKHLAMTRIASLLAETTLFAGQQIVLSSAAHH
jgi:DNA-binding LytR/AlgR family response regulator